MAGLRNYIVRKNQLSSLSNTVAHILGQSLQKG